MPTMESSHFNTSAPVRLPVPLQRPVSRMSSTLTATTSPLAATATATPHQFPELTAALRATSTNPYASPSARYLDATTQLRDESSSEPPHKRVKTGAAPTWRDSRVFQACLREQVFPHVDKSVSDLQTVLSKSSAEALAIGKEVTRTITGPEFTQEYRKGNGRISLEYEGYLARRVPVEIQRLLARPNPVTQAASLPASSKSVRPSVETPVPLPATRLTIPTLPNLPKSVTAASKYSSSPVPLPAIGHQAPQPGHHTSRAESQRTPSATVATVSAPLVSKSPIPIPKYAEEGANHRPPARHGVTPAINSMSASPAPGNLLPANTRKTIPAPTAPSTKRATPDSKAPRASVAARNSGILDKPYLSSRNRIFALNSAQEFLPLSTSELPLPLTIHVDFTSSEIEQLRTVVWDVLGITKKSKDAKRDLRKALKDLRERRNAEFSKLVKSCEGRLPGRKQSAIENVFKDLIHKETSAVPARLTMKADNENKQGEFLREAKIGSLLLARQIVGSRGFSTRRPQSFRNELKKSLEDDLDLRAQWIGCAGDIVTIAWTSNDGFICGTTEHSDAHNQQYNKPGNLALGSCSLKTLRAYPQHRIVRPIIQQGENSTESMRESQDPWLYSSVVASDYDSAHDRAYTGGFDRSVKIWKVESSGNSMNLLGEWPHDGNVNFVAASRHPSGMVATGADVSKNAVRIYFVDGYDLSASPYRSFSCSRVTDADGNAISTEKWAYYPATMQWGIAEEVQHLLLVGYSPRSQTGDDGDIPVDRRDSGELCLWNGLTGERWRVLSAKNSNVFEVLWHPTQPSFIAATSPSGLEPEAGSNTKTQIRVFTPAPAADHGANAFSNIKVLDCPAIDINELTIMPNSCAFSYITAGCTDGNVYVWDTALSDKPVHVLRHGTPIDEPTGDREREDVGVKFTAWGSTPDRFYTGSSDGMVKVWNVRSHYRPLVKNLLEAPAPICSGMFSPDKKKMVVGDASGRVFMLSVDKDETEVSKTVARRPKLIIHHPEPAPPTHDAAGKPLIIETGASRARDYLMNRQLILHPNRTVGAIKGPNYAETGLYLLEAHLNKDPEEPLLAAYEKQQQEALDSFPNMISPIRRFILKKPILQVEGIEERDRRNKELELDREKLPEMTKTALKLDGVDWELMEDVVLNYEEGPDIKGFRDQEEEMMEIVEID